MKDSDEMTLGEMVSEIRGLEASKQDPEMYKALLLRLLKAVDPKVLIQAFLDSWTPDLPSDGKRTQQQLLAVVFIVEVLNDWIPTASFFDDTLAALQEHRDLPDMRVRSWGCCSQAQVVSLGPTRQTLAFLRERSQYMREMPNSRALRHDYPDVGERMRFVTLDMIQRRTFDNRWHPFRFYNPSDVGDGVGALCESCGQVMVRRAVNKAYDKRNRRMSAALTELINGQGGGPPT